MDFERKTVVRAICLNRNPEFRTSKHCPLACVFGISVGVVQNPKLWILEIGSEFRNLDFARTLFRYPYRVIFGISVGGNIHGPVCTHKYILYRINYEVALLTACFHWVGILSMLLSL